MRPPFATRISQIERAFDLKVPEDARAFLSDFSHFDEGTYLIQYGGEESEIRTTYRLDEGPDYPQLDGLLARVGKAIPKFTFPIAADWGGNFFLFVTDGENENQIVFWDHERQRGDYSVRPTGFTLSEFLSGMKKAET